MIRSGPTTGAAALLALLALPAAAQQPRPANPTPALAPPAATTDPAQPERTAATYGDWTLRCEAQAAGGRACEVVQAVLDPRGQAVAQLAIGRPAIGGRLLVVLHLPVNAAVDQPVRLAAEGAPQPILSLPFRTCVPRGCFAQAQPGEQELAILRRRVEPVRAEYRDAGQAPVAVSLSLRGLAAALDALEREQPAAQRGR